MFTKQHNPIKSTASAIQQSFINKADDLNLTDAQKGVFVTLTIGYKKALSQDIRKKFSLTGVSHILAVSGFHVAVVCSFISLLLRWFSRHKLTSLIQYFSTIILLWGYVFITGLAASAIRAGVMLTFYLTGKILGKTSDSYNTLAAAAFCMLAYNPSFLFDIGFQLSFTAVFFILLLQPLFNKSTVVRNPLLSFPWAWLTMALSAQIGTTFLSFFYFGYFSPVFIFTNIPVMFFATFLIPAGLTWLLLPTDFIITNWLQAGIEWSIQLMIKVVERFSTIPFSSIMYRFDLIDIIGGYSILLLFILYIYKRQTPVLILTLTLLLTLLTFKCFKYIIS